MKPFMNLFSGVILRKRGSPVKGKMSLRHFITYSLTKQFYVGDNAFSQYSVSISLESGTGHHLLRQVPRGFLQPVQAHPDIVTPRLIHDHILIS